jgi:hypothetical protein
MKLIEVEIPANLPRKVIKTDDGLYIQRTGDPEASVTGYCLDPEEPVSTSITPSFTVEDESLLTEKLAIDLSDRIFDNNGAEYCAVYYPETEETTITINEETKTLVGKRPGKFYKG